MWPAIVPVLMAVIPLQEKLEVSFKMTAHGRNLNPGFYRRVLPDGCISFLSTEGKTIFKEALLSGHMESYFKLAAQFSTQADVSFCGLTTLVMILNALEVDPGKVWKGPWRWYHEDMLECCALFPRIKDNGVTFDQFVCLAACNSLEVESTRLDDSASIEIFRDHVTRLSRHDDQFIVLSYSRKVLGQTGEGHISSIGGYHPSKDLLLVMDTARFKYPPHWVPLETIWEAMKALDTSTGKSRGYCILSRLNKQESLRFFKLSKFFSVSLLCDGNSSISTFFYKLREFLMKTRAALLLEDLHVKMSSVNIDIFRQLVLLLLKSVNCVTQSDCIVYTFMDFTHFSDEHNSLKETLLNQIECLELYNIVHNVLQTFGVRSDPCLNISNAGDSKALILDGGNCGVAPAKCTELTDTKLRSAHVITVFILCWPYELFKVTEEVTVADKVNAYVTNWLESTISRELKEEVLPLKRQLLVLMKARSVTQDQRESDSHCTNHNKVTTSCAKLCETTTSGNRNQ